MSAGLAIDLVGVRPAHFIGKLGQGEALAHHEGTTCTINLPLALPLRGGRRQIESSANRAARPDPTLIAALRRAHAILGRERGKVTLGAAPVSPYERRLLLLAFLAPNLQRDILQGK